MIRLCFNKKYPHSRVSKIRTLRRCPLLVRAIFNTFLLLKMSPKTKDQIVERFSSESKDMSSDSEEYFNNLVNKKFVRQ